MGADGRQPPGFPLLLGVALGDLLNGLPINQNHDYTGDFWNLLTGYGLMTGVNLLTLCLLQGATFLALRPPTRSAIVPRRGPCHRVDRDRGERRLGGLDPGRDRRGDGSAAHADLRVMAVSFATALTATDYDGWAFTASSFGIAASIGQIFIALYPNVMISSTKAAYNLTVNNSAAGHYPLFVMTIVAVVFLPLVLLYQGWSFHVFRRRVTAPPASPGQRAPSADLAAGGPVPSGGAAPDGGGTGLPAA